MDPSESITEFGAWLSQHWLGLLVGTIAAFAAFRLARPLVHRLVLRVMRPPTTDGVDPEIIAAETAKRAATIEALLSQTIRFGVILAVVFAILTVLGLLPVLAALGLVLAGIAFAGQPIVLDYLMGILILVEGQYYRGDWIAVAGIEGEVEEVGLRRTTLRDGSGTVHSLSNGTIRVSSNLTRVYAALLVDVPILRGADLDRAIKVIDEVGHEMADDPEWAPRLIEPPRFARVTGLGEQGVTLRVTGKVRATDRWSVPGEVRRRLAIAFDVAGIELPTRARLLAGEAAAVPASPGGGPTGPTPPAT